MAFAVGRVQGGAAIQSQATVLPPGMERWTAALYRVSQGADDALPGYPQVRRRAAVAAARSALAADWERATATCARGRRAGRGDRRQLGGTPATSPPRRASPGPGLWKAGRLRHAMLTGERLPRHPARPSGLGAAA